MIIENKTDYGYMSYYKNDQAFAESLNANKIYEEGLVINYLSDHIKKSKLILDIGAHAGSHTVLYKYLNPSATIYCFEPQKRMYEILCHNVSQNKFKDVHTYNLAIGHTKMKYTMSSSAIDGDNANRQIYYGTEDVYNLGGLQIGKGGEEISINTVDSFGFNKVDFMKIDVEGFEPLVILGAMDTIKRSMPTILFEHNHKTISKSILQDMGIESLLTTEEMLSDLGYKISKLDDQGNYLATR